MFRKLFSMTGWPIITILNEDCSFIYLTKFRYRKLTCNQSLYYTTTRHTCHKNHLIVPVVKFREKLVERNDHPCAALPIGGCCTILVATRPLLFVKTRLKESSLTLSTSCLRGPPSHQGGSPWQTLRETPAQHCQNHSVEHNVELFQTRHKPAPDRT